MEYGFVRNTTYPLQGSIASVRHTQASSGLPCYCNSSTRPPAELKSTRLDATSFLPEPSQFNQYKTFFPGLRSKGKRSKSLRGLPSHSLDRVLHFHRFIIRLLGLSSLPGGFTNHHTVVISALVDGAQIQVLQQRHGEQLDARQHERDNDQDPHRVVVCRVDGGAFSSAPWVLDRDDGGAINLRDLCL